MTERRDPRILVVSERPEFIHLASRELTDRARVIGCIGPVQSPCNLEARGECPLAAHASVALVDAPGSGYFVCHWKVMPAGTYAERLQQAHPGCTVILSGAPEGEAGATGDVITAASSPSALKLLKEVLDVRARLGMEVADAHQ